LTTNFVIDEEIEINRFINIFRNYIQKNCLKIKDRDKYKNTNFKIMNEDILVCFDNIKDTYLKSFIYPPIPMCHFKFNDDINELEIDKLCSSGISGSILYNNDGCIGLLVSSKESTHVLEILPFELILDLIEKYNQNNFNFSYIPYIIEKNCVLNCALNPNINILKNDYVTSINNKKLNDNFIFVEKYNINMNYQTYVLLYCSDYVTIKLTRLKKFKNKTNTINIKLNINLLEYNFNLITLNFKENNNSVKLNDFEFKEMSEEYILKNINKNVIDIDYNDIYKKKKMIYLDNITNKYKDINIERNIYILHKISGHKIFTLNDIKKYMSNVNLTIELLDPSNNIVKIKI
jgi:hypothetical protein